MKKYLTYTLMSSGLFLIFFLFSCEKEIDLELPDPEIKIVVEGWIDQGDYPVVMLTKSSPYFSVVDSASLMNMIIQNATVIVSDGFTVDTLQPAFDLNYFPPFLFKGSKFKGEVGKTYTLKVVTDSLSLTAITTIPAPVAIDSLWFKVEADKDSLGYIWGKFQDPPAEQNFYRLFTKRLGKDNRFNPMLGSIYDDKFFDGQSFEFSMMRGIESYTDTTEDAEITYFKAGDTVVVKACTIDKAHYDFWRTAEGDMFTSGNPFASPSQIITNIQGGGLGVWGGYGVFTDTVICKK